MLHSNVLSFTILNGPKFLKSLICAFLGGVAIARSEIVTRQFTFSQLQYESSFKMNFHILSVFGAIQYGTTRGQFIADYFDIAYLIMLHPYGWHRVHLWGIVFYYNAQI